jgi:hypothetical protein
MKRYAAATALIFVTLLIAVSGDDPSTKLQETNLAWDRGDYPAALKAYLGILDAQPPDAIAEAIAEQTGEVFRTVELTPDGGTPRFAPAGGHFTYEIGRGVMRRTRLSAAAAPQHVIAELPGYGAAFSLDGTQVAYLQLNPTPEMRAVEANADKTTGAERTRLLGALAALTETAARIVVRDLADGRERVLDTGARRKNAVRLGSNGLVLFTGSEDGGADQVYAMSEGRPPSPITTGDPAKVLQDINTPGTAALFTYRTQGRRGGRGEPPRFGVIALPGITTTTITGSAPAFSGDGRTLAYVTRTPQNAQLLVTQTDALDRPGTLRSGDQPLDAPALSRDGRRVVYQMTPREDWELYVHDRDAQPPADRRLTREIQHDLLPRFLDGNRVLGMIGEARHRRSYLYDLSTGARTRLFHNNTVRTIAPEYEWVPSPDGTMLLIVAERDGDTVSPQRGVYLMDLTKKVSREEVRDRIRTNLAAEEALRAKGKRAFAPIADAVGRVTSEASTARIFGYEEALYDFDSKHISQPGNKLASTYLFETYKSFGYEPEYQWFSPNNALGGRTANVLATLKGTVDPDLVYVVSSHYDSVAGGPGADDDTSGTAALLETARLLAKHPQPATIVFASFTGEEGGLLGSREYVRRAVADKVRIVGALNNDMVGWSNDHRLDNTIRYSNAGIRDIQHGAAIQFSNLITYDALYYKSTDAHAYYEAFGDIVGGIGSYPVLGNPHYHQPHDTLDTINHQLITEVARTTTATLMLLASSPSRLQNLTIGSYQNGSAAVTWTPSPEKGVAAYIVAWGPPDKPEAQQIRVTKPAAVVKAPPGTVVSVKAVNQRGLEGWDWARAVVR